MEKEQLIEYFCKNYLPKQEVLFRLPFNVQLDRFWNELLSRRKLRAVMLPLHNAKGYPYWFVVTDKMIKASEVLCEQARSREQVFDPYRMQMTSAMTEEMFYTSFVEGAQISFPDAMDFLEAEKEPENIFEQMIWNNQQAWSAMVNGIYHKINEPYLMELAALLTDGMDNSAEGSYRDTDTHPIAAMEDDYYEVPFAVDIPRRMEEFYAFMGDGNIHPLIKAAAGQAFLLCTRPFSEGNERLARMISSAVLLRSGYDFFKEISISGTIAAENYLYYKNMQEILKPENGEDLTYFMEYYLELLVKAIQRNSDREQLIEKESLTRERELSTIPLMAHSEEENHPTEDVPVVGAEELLEPPAIIPEHDYLPEESGEDEDHTNNSIQLDENRFNEIIERLGMLRTTRKEMLISYVKKKYEMGVVYFTRQDVEEELGLSFFQAKSICADLKSAEAAVNTRPHGQIAKYQFCYAYDSKAIVKQNAKKKPKKTFEDRFEKVIHGQQLQEKPLEVDDRIVAKLEEISTLSDVSSRRIAIFVKKCIQCGKEYFTAQEWSYVHERSLVSSNFDLRNARGYGLVKKCDDECTYSGPMSRFSTN